MKNINIGIDPKNLVSRGLSSGLPFVYGAQQYGSSQKQRESS